MGIAADLGYHHRNANPFHRLMQAFAGSRVGGWVFARTLRHIDDVVGRLSRGRTSAPELLAGLPGSSCSSPVTDVGRGAPSGR